MAGSKAYIEYMPLSEIRGAPRNPKEHDLGALHVSIERFGFADPPTINERTSRLVEGHGRVDVLRQMKVAGEPEPRHVRVENGEWLLPVVRGLEWETDEEAEAYIVAHNRIGEVGGWNDSLLTSVLSDLAAADALDGIGYDADDVDKMLAGESLPQPGDAEEEGVEGVFGVIVKCDTEGEQVELLGRLSGEGLRVRAMRDFYSAT